jgi:hypothetical protein
MNELACSQGQPRPRCSPSNRLVCQAPIRHIASRTPTHRLARFCIRVPRRRRDRPSHARQGPLGGRNYVLRMTPASGVSQLLATFSTASQRAAGRRVCGSDPRAVLSCPNQQRNEQKEDGCHRQRRACQSYPKSTRRRPVWPRSRWRSGMPQDGCCRIRACDDGKLWRHW